MLKLERATALIKNQNISIITKLVGQQDMMQFCDYFKVLFNEEIIVGALIVTHRNLTYLSSFSNILGI
ncbi:hypothetical protein [Paenibacillus alvei]|uniref:hypothetical protein n=1 Tax=Paenibacillus alvei TaxID=44250 RepID=UPI001F50A5BD|nr:hypothetical protein [Paenibacillus alvei]